MADDTTTQPTTSRTAFLPTAARSLLVAGMLLFVAVEPALAQTGTAFCDTDMAATIKNVFTLIQFGGPLVGGVIAMGAIVAMPSVRQADRKKELKETRNQALIYGVIAAPLATAIIQFLLNHVVAGGTSCGF